MAEIIKNISQMNLGLASGPVYFGEVTYAPGGSCGPRRQRDYQLVVIHRGEVELRLDRRSIRLAAGEAILLRPRHREHFLFSRDGETRHSWCSLRPAAVPKALRRHFRGEPRPVRFGERMRAVLDWAREHAATPAGPAGKRFFLALGLALVSDFALAAKREAPPLRSSADAVARLDTIIRRDFAQPLTLGDLARRAGVSPQHLLKLCRAHHAPTPLEQLYRRRLDAASEWLAGTGLSIGEIADRCGFANQFHFSRRFRQAHGRSPRAWRKRAWGG